MDERPIQLRPRNVGDLLTEAFELYRRNFVALLTIAAIIAIPLSIIEQLALDAITADVQREVIVRGEDVELGGGFWQAIWAAITTGVIAAIIYNLVTAATTRAAANAAVGRRPTVGDSYQGALGRLGAVLIAALLIGLGVGLGFLLLIVPGIFLLVRWVAALPAIVVERRGATEGMRRSWNLVRGRGWHVFSAVIVSSLITAVATSVFTAFGGESALIRGVLSGIAAALVLPFTASVYVLLYLDLRARSENLDVGTLTTELDR